MSEQTETAKRAEDSIKKKFHKKLFSRFTKGIVEYELIAAGDKIAVCMSGGKDSFVMAKLFQELKRHNKIPFELVFVVLDGGYSKANRELTESNAKLLDVPVTVFGGDTPSLSNLYDKAKELSCNKIALGHHYDDVIQTIFAGMLYGGRMHTMMPKERSVDFDGMELIRPMYLVREEHIQAWCDYNKLIFIEREETEERIKIKELIQRLESEDEGIEQNIFRSVENVSLKTVIEYKDKDGVSHRFTDEY